MSSHPAHAVSEAGGIVDTSDPSAHDDALGGLRALNAAGPFAAWGNPAALASATFSSVGYSQSTLAKPFADDVWILHGGASFHYGTVGIGLLYSKLDQGEQSAVGGSFDSWQKSVQLGVGWSALEVLAPDIDPRRLRLLLGGSLNRIHDFLAPSRFTQDGADVRATGYSVDAGARIEVGIDAPGTHDAPDHFTLVAALAVDNLFDGELDFGNDYVDPLAKWVHFGGLFRAEFLNQGEFGPLLRADVLAERSVATLEGDDTDIQRLGFELVAAQTLSVRVADYKNPENQISGSTYGVGISLGRLDLPVDVRVDFSSRPQAAFFDRADLWSVQVRKSFD
jgi:hypothetical protein